MKKIVIACILLCLITGCEFRYSYKSTPTQPKYIMQNGVVHEVVCNGQNCRLVPRPDLKEIPK